MVIRRLYISPAQDFFGHHARPAGDEAAVEVPSITCRAGLGITGDRFFGYRPDYKGQMTFFAWEVYEQAKRHFALPALAPSAFRRNVLVEGIDLNSLFGTEFSIGGVEFLGTEESRPCYWMDNAIAPGAEAWLRGNCGLRVRILSDGELRKGPASVTVLAEKMALAGRR